MNPDVDLTENEVIELYSTYLKNNGWNIESHALNREHGTDIVAKKGNNFLVVEAKGARGNPSNKNVVREKFDSGQIKDHLGKAIVKALELKSKYQSEGKIVHAIILHPKTVPISKIIDPIKGFIQLMNVGVQYIDKQGNVT